MVVELAKDASGSARSGAPPSSGRRSVDTTAFQLTDQGGNPNAAVAGDKRLTGVANYFIGSNPKDWHIHIPPYQAVTVHSVYPGINLEYHASPSGGLEYDYQVAAGSDPNQIAASLSGVREGFDSYAGADAEAYARVKPEEGITG
jgi:hypothetical protein